MDCSSHVINYAVSYLLRRELVSSSLLLFLFASATASTSLGGRLLIPNPPIKMCGAGCWVLELGSSMLMVPPIDLPITTPTCVLTDIPQQ